MTHLHLLCDEGISGDLLVAALADAGAPPDDLRAAVSRAGVPATLEVEHCEARHVRATRVRVTAPSDAAPIDRIAGLHAIVDAAGLPARAAERAHAIVAALGRAEAAVHGVPVDQVRLHELGRPRTAATTIAVAVALELLDVDEVTVGPVAVGDGAVEIAHGRFPVPAPAVLHLLAGFEVEGGGRRQELTTPSGAAVLAALAAPAASTPRLHLAGHGRGVAGDGASQRLLTALVGGRS